ncbi:SLATT domain-containing protein [Sphingopyxis sp. Root1497]|uniref:SLATT domain-containing protein n=1 Tax=Sphingopyxis sp. Root1497 TaxID=1736474 RepID=UPI0012E3E9CD|nr:SLATT domain-containing protein [Sphingopyxis sp. Root1497]
MESVEKKVDFLRKSLDRDADSFRRKIGRNKTSAFRTKIYVASAAAMLSIIIGSKSNQIVVENGLQSSMDMIALVISASVAVVSAYEAFFDHRWLWMKYTNTLSQLYAVSDDLDFIVANESIPSEEALEKIHLRRQEVLRETGAAWYDKRAQASALSTLSS